MGRGTGVFCGASGNICKPLHVLATPGGQGGAGRGVMTMGPAARHRTHWHTTQARMSAYPAHSPRQRSVGVAPPCREPATRYQ